MKSAVEQIIDERMKSFKDSIIAYRRENKYSWSEISEECELNHRTVRDFCLSNNSKKISADTLMRIEISLGIKL